MSKTVDYYHFLLSPWSYLAIGRFNTLREKYDLTVNYKPIGVMETFTKMGGTPPAKRHPSRQRYRMDELKRWSAHLGVPITLNPAHWPVDQSMAAQMVYAAGGATGSTAAADLSDALITACWRDEKDISDEATLVSVAVNCELDGPELLGQAKSDSFSNAYAKRTTEAFERDVFGSPTYIVDGEIFWGQDRLEFLENALA